MMGGYLARVVESGITSMRDVRGSIAGTRAERNGEEQQAAEPFTSNDREQTGPARTLSEPRSDARVDSRNPSVALPQDARVQPDVTSYGAPAIPVQSLAPPTVDSAFPTRPLDTRIEERPSGETVSAVRPDAKPTDAEAPSLKDAGIRSVRGGSSSDGGPTVKAARHQRAVAFDVTVHPFDRAADDDAHQQRALSRPGHSNTGEGEQPPPPPGVSASRVEQWKRLKDRLLIEHFHSRPEGPPLPSSTSNDEHSASQPANVNSTSREIVIEQLEVVVAAPHPAPPLPMAGPRARPPRSGAWSVATRRYLGRL